MSDPNPQEKPRALALDALRGLTILLMVFSGRIPYGVLPAWMYHAQVPPPDHLFRPDLPGITWVDLVFPFFLFSMGAAIPLALAPRLRAGAGLARVVTGIARRGLLLAAFAIYVMHIRPWLLHKEPTVVDYALCLLGFGLLFPMFLQMPKGWSWPWRSVVRVAGWGGAALLLSTLTYADGSGFSLGRSDIIILVLANVSVAGALLWVATQRQPLLRFGFLALLLALRLSHTAGGWAGWIWEATPAPWLYKMLFLNYLFIVIPGTVVGDLLVSWMGATPTPGCWSRRRLVLLSGLPIALNAAMVIGLQSRMVIETMAMAMALSGILLWLVRKASSPSERLLGELVRWGTFWLLLGLLFEPFEGGIKKDHSTLSYYFVTSGLAVSLLITFLILIDILKKERPVRLLVRSGQNPLIAYAGITSLVPPVLGLTGADRLIESVTTTPWLGVLRGAFHTYLVALAAALATRWKVFLKA
jgi:predicted acyltransferase